MAAKRTEKSCYESRYGAEWITAPKRLAEMACERLAGNTALGAKFWQNAPWDKVFAREITFANRLLNRPFSMEAIVAAYTSKQGRRVKSLMAPFFVPMVEEEQRRIDLESKQLETSTLPEHVNTLEKPRPVKRPGKSIRERLADTHNAPTERGLFDTDE